MTERQVLACLLAIALLFAALHAVAGSASFCDVCQPTRYVQKGADLQIWCGSTLWMTYKGCPKARVTWDRTKSKVKVTCGG